MQFSGLRTVSVTLILLLTLSACGDNRTPLVVYSPHGREMLGAYEKLFEEAYPDVDVRWFPMGAEVVLERIRSERENPQADIWWGGPSVLFEQAEREGLIAPYTPTWTEYARPGSHSANNAWYGTFQTIKVIGYNDEVLDATTAPSDWDDFLDERWRGNVIIRSPMESGTMKSVFSAMIYRDFAETGSPEGGYDWLRKLDANTKAYAASPAALMLMIARREGTVTLWDLTDILLQRREQNVPISYKVPKSGAVVLNEGIAVVRGTKRDELATRFYEFVTSKDALVHQATDYFRVPTRMDIDPADLPDWLRELEYSELPVDWEVVGTHRDTWMGYWDQSIKNRGATSNP